MDSGFGLLGLVVLGIIVAVLWLCVPFILLTMNGHLKRLLGEQERTNALLTQRLPDLSRRDRADPAK